MDDESLANIRDSLERIATAVEKLAADVQGRAQRAQLTFADIEAVRYEAHSYTLLVPRMMEGATYDASVNVDRAFKAEEISAEPSNALPMSEAGRPNLAQWEICGIWAGVDAVGIGWDGTTGVSAESVCDRPIPFPAVQTGIALRVRFRALVEQESETLFYVNGLSIAWGPKE